VRCLVHGISATNYTATQAYEKFIIGRGDWLDIHTGWHRTLQYRVAVIFHFSISAQET
jgi:hypothetical protein